MSVRLETVADERGPFTLRLVGEGEVALGQTGRRRFAAVVPDLRPGPHRGVLVAGPGGAEEAVELVVPAGVDGGREGRAVGPAMGLLERVAAMTGGRMQPAPREVLAARAGMKREVRPLGGVLIPLAIVLILADIALRRAR